MARLQIRELDFVDKLVMTSDQRLLPIAQMFDAQGRATADHRHAVLCIAGTPGEWVSFRLADYRKSSLQ
jgi:hypothetical protein